MAALYPGTLTLEHKDPRNHSLVCGLKNDLNETQVDHSFNSRKQNRFVPYRVCGFPAPENFGDFCEFLVGEVWTVCEYGGKTWWAQANKNGCGSTKPKPESARKAGKASAALPYKDINYYTRLSSAAIKITSKPVKVTHTATGETFEFPSVCQAARELDLQAGHLSSVARGLRRQHKGFIAEFIK